jgi:hypothetical protein
VPQFEMQPFVPFSAVPGVLQKSGLLDLFYA